MQRRFQAMYGGGVLAVSEQDGSLDNFVGTLQTRSDVGVGGGAQSSVLPSANMPIMLKQSAGVWEVACSEVEDGAQCQISCGALSMSHVSGSLHPSAGIFQPVLQRAEGHCSYSTACGMLVEAPWLQCLVLHMLWLPEQAGAVWDPARREASPVSEVPQQMVPPGAHQNLGRSPCCVCRWALADDADSRPSQLPWITSCACRGVGTGSCGSSFCIWFLILRGIVR